MVRTPPDNWEHSSGYKLNADGKSIEYEHQSKDLLAIIEAMVDEKNQRLEFYTVIFDIGVNEKPWPTVEPHDTHMSKDTAFDTLFELMSKHG